MRNSKESVAGYSGSGTRVRAPRGAAISCKSWQQEGALRMLMNSADPDVAERAELLIACSKLGAVAADWSSFGEIVASLRDLTMDDTLLVQQGKPAGVAHASAESPRALILNSDAAASWTYIGPQCFLPEAHEFFAAAQRKYFDGELGGKLVASPGMNGVRCALALAATMNGAAFLGIEEDSERIKRCVKAGYCDVMVNGLDEALRILKNAVRKREAASVGLIGSAAEVVTEMASRGVVPDLLMGFWGSWNGDAVSRLDGGIRALEALGSIAPRSLLRPFSEEDSDSIWWVAPSGEMADIQRLDRLLLELFAEDEPLGRFIRTVQRRVRHQGLPARACLLNAVQRRKFGIAVNRLVAAGELKAPVVMVRQVPLYASGESWGEGGGAASLDTKEIAALLELSRGATWASIDRDDRGHARVTAKAVVVDGGGEMAARIERAL